MTTKQAKAAQYIAEGDSVSKAMQKAGYAKTTSRNPQQLTRSKTFREIMESIGISDKKIAERLNEGLDATTAIKTERVEGVGKNRLKTEELTTRPDYLTRHRYLETSLKLKGHEKAPPQSTIIVPIYGGLSGRPEDVPLPGHNSDTEDIQTKATH